MDQSRHTIHAYSWISATCMSTPMNVPSSIHAHLQWVSTLHISTLAARTKLRSGSLLDTKQYILKKDPTVSVDTDSKSDQLTLTCTLME
eukprot:1139454-Pelagomonas_calceolata.AAC.5